MKIITHEIDGLIFTIEIEEEKEPIFGEARRHVMNDLKQTANLGKLNTLYNMLKTSPLEYECAPCSVTLKHGGYSGD